MPKFSLIRPIDQPLGKRRLLQDLKIALQDKRFTDFQLIVAYAKSGPLNRLQDLLEEWRRAGNTSTAIMGIDQQGTSKDALELALYLFDCVYVVREAGITFHPKMYLFKGEHHAEAFIGSNNLTVGGTEKNFEAAIHLKLDLPADAAELGSLESSWSELLPDLCPATTQLDSFRLAQLVEDNVVVEEKTMRPGAGDGDATSVGRGWRSGLVVKPESPLPRKALDRALRVSTKRTIPSATSVATTGSSQTQPAAAEPAATRGHVIQIKPHDNGEIFLSVTAVKQNPDFFGWPFTGMTVPKKPGNPSYPQLDPDPVVNIRVFGAKLEPVLTLSKYQLNTVYYARKSEIRITALPLVGIVPEYSIMIMEPSSTSSISYEITIHTPDSLEYEAWVAACNQKMPSGGKDQRKYGWF